MTTPPQYDVFLSYHAPDREAVIYLAQRLQQAGIQPWFDEWSLYAGEMWMTRLEQAIAQCTACAVFIGPHGIGRWQQREAQVAIQSSDGLGSIFPVIPVLLPGASQDIPKFLDIFSWVKFHTSLDDDEAFHRLVQGIRRGRRIPQAAESSAILEASSSLSKRPTPEPRIVGLPALLTSLIGRAADVDALETRLRDPDARLITLLGPGGIGKTRLAIAVAWRVLPFFRDGVYYVPLAAIGDANLVAPAIAQSLNVEEQASQSLATSIAAHIRDQSLLLVLDNFEQVLAAAQLVLDLLVNAPGLHVLVTSRELLNLNGEQQVDVQPLAIPDLHALPNLLTLLEYPAVAVFVQHIQKFQPQFALTEDNAPLVAEICARLDGIPLAIELVAAQLKGFRSLRDILDHLDQVMLTAADRARDRIERHRTMRNTIAWSYDSLSTEEQMLFAALAVFAGGCSLDAAEAVCATGEQEQLEETLRSLVEKSLVQYPPVEDEQKRLTMLEVIRAFARERLKERPDAALLRQRHAEFFHQLAERAAPALDGPDQQQWMDLLDYDRDNLREAARWLLEHQQTVAALRLSGALWRFWYNRGYLSEGRGQIELSLSQARAELEQGNLSAGREISAALARAVDGLGSLAQKQGNYTKAIEQYQEALIHYRQIEDEQEVAQTLYRLGLATMRAGDGDRARQLLEESLALNKSLQNTRGAARAHNNLGMLAHYSGDYDGAYHHYMESLTFLRELEDEVNIAIGLGNVGEVAFMRGDFADAQRNFAQSLTMCNQLDEPEGIAFCLDWLAQVAAAQEDTLHAARLWGAAEALRDATGVSLAPADREALAARTAEAHAQLIAEEWDSAWATGWQLSREQAVEMALKLPSQMSRNSPTTASQDQSATNSGQE